MLESLKIAVINTLLIVTILPIIGLILSIIENKTAKILCKLLGVKATSFILNKLTFIGTIHHELSHALFVICSGAKLKNIELFKPDKKTGTLGKVRFITRGPSVIKSIQMCLISVAPMICGSISICISIILIVTINLSSITLLVVIYIAISILLHMQMSKQDLINCKKGAPICAGILFLIIWILKIDILNFILSLYYK